MSLRHAVLGLLAEQPGSGYDLLKTFQTSLGNVWPATQSQLYSELGKLADAGLVSVTAEGPRGRKEYAITGTGLVELRHWLIEVPPAGIRRNDMALRVFFLGSVEKDQARDYLRKYAASSAAHHESLQELDKSVNWDDDDNLSVYGKLVLEWGLRLTAMQHEWAVWADQEVAKARPKPV